MRKSQKVFELGEVKLSFRSSGFKVYAHSREIDENNGDVKQSQLVEFAVPDGESPSAIYNQLLAWRGYEIRVEGHNQTYMASHQLSNKPDSEFKIYLAEKFSLAHDYGDLPPYVSADAHLLSGYEEEVAQEKRRHVSLMLKQEHS